MPNFASVTLIGHLGRDPETRYTPSNTSVTSFSLATSRKDGQGQETTTWWRCTCFGKRGDVIAQYFRKGDPILVQGEPSLREYSGKDGQARTSLEVIVNDFSFIKGRKDADHGDSYNDAAPKPGNGNGKSPGASQPDSAWPDDDILF